VTDYTYQIASSNPYSSSVPLVTVTAATAGAALTAPTNKTDEEFVFDAHLRSGGKTLDFPANTAFNESVELS